MGSQRKTDIMKNIFATVVIAAFFAACNSNPKTAEQPVVQPDTAGLAQFKTWKQQQEFMEQSRLYNGVNDPNANNLQAEAPREGVKERVVYVDRPAPKKRSTARRTSSASSSSGSNTSNGSVASAPAPVAKKKGWSSAAKGTAIGAGSGAVLGAVISKNKAAGAVIGGVVGGVGGYVIGRNKDKKTGRAQ